MAYAETVALRINKALVKKKGIMERKMFGGKAYMFNGHMFCGVIENKLVLRLGNDGVLEALNKKYTSEMDFTGKVIKSMVYVEPDGFRTEKALNDWIKQALGFVKTLPPK